MTAECIRGDRLGLTATLIREDGREGPTCSRLIWPETLDRAVEYIEAHAGSPRRMRPRYGVTLTDSSG